MWYLFEPRQRSPFARLISIIASLVILISVVTFCLETLPEYRLYEIQIEQIGNGRKMVYYPSSRRRYSYEDVRNVMKNHSISENFTGQKQKYRGIDNFLIYVQPLNVLGLTQPFFSIESLNMLWFSLELVLRFCSCPNRVHFYASFMNIVDLV